MVSQMICPCKNCITYSICINKKELKCSILFDEFAEKVERGESHIVPLTNLDSLQYTTEYSKHRVWILHPKTGEIELWR